MLQSMLSLDNPGLRGDDDVSSIEDDNGLPPSIVKKKPEFVKKQKSKYKGGKLETIFLVD